MARRVFFSFHYERDIFRVSQVRMSGVTKGGYEESGFIDHPDWEKIERAGHAAIKRWIDTQMQGASVLAVLIGAETAGRPWVNYEIERARALSLGLLGVRIHNCRDPRTGNTDYAGANPFDGFRIGEGLWARPLSTIVPIYDWVNDRGYANFGSWVEAAAKAAGR
ncbi:MAG: TIR domain-containing protein [Candidatus Didemnitutus sp.]|nr:TIR domain-containing protein [Candidatus Didemnitutus sp.]